MSENTGHLDEQQAQLVERLRSAGGAPVTFDELRDIGIESPALLCYELAAVGLPITRTASPAEGMPALSVRLETVTEPFAAAGDPVEPPESEEICASRGVGSRRQATARALAALRSRRVVAQRLGSRLGLSIAEHRPRPRALGAMLALALVVGTVIAIALGDLTRGGATGGRALRPAGRAVVASSRTDKGPGTPDVGMARPLPVPGSANVGAAPSRVSPAAADELEAQGHQLLAQGSYASAIPALASAIRASGQSLARCTEPATEACLTFAYALYDLGRALRLDGRQGEAVSILSERLLIDNQRPTVQHELELARGARA
ncbi:MAG: hypothetical protein E6G62_09540 [Actinobacteria bacterium]|nr:MAG: hypothetical protein E6G62_09540 [Actinomycetota bacterium]